MDAKVIDKVKHYVLQRLERELSLGLYYHGLWHTAEDVVPAVEIFARGESIMGEERDLMLTAAWFHDLGFIETWDGHEKVSARIVSEVLPNFGYTDSQVEIIKGIIMATVVPQNPVTLLGKILADADLDVLGRDDFMLCNENLRRELAYFGREFTDLDWYTNQLEFIQTHTYFTSTARYMRDGGKLKNIELVKHMLNDMDR